MFYNHNIYIVLILGIILFYLGRVLAKKINNNIFVILLLITISLPAISFIFYYFHLIDNKIDYIEFRSINNIEILTIFLGLLIGYISKITSKNVKDRKGFSIYLGLTVIFLLIPFIKPIISPVNKYNKIQNKWKDDICIQTTGSTCGPSSMATIFKFYGINKTEEEIARNAFTSGSSTELWYLIRYARNQGLKVKVYNNKKLNEIPSPAIIGTKIGGNVGHFITILEKKDNKFIIGDSLTGKKEMEQNDFEKEYVYDGIGIHIMK